MEQIITSLLENDLYKFSMGQAIFHQYPDYTTTWTFKCRNEGVKFIREMVDEIRDQILKYCDLSFTDDEIKYLEDNIEWLDKSYVEFLRLWHPQFKDFSIYYDENVPYRLTIEASGSWINTSMYEVPVLSIVNEVYFRMNLSFNSSELFHFATEKLTEKIVDLKSGEYKLGAYSEFGMRRRLSKKFQDHLVETLCKSGTTEYSKFVGTSNVYLAKKYNCRPVGTMAHEFIMCVGQGNHKHNPAYSNWYMMNSWVKEYGVLNGIALTDTIGTDVFLKDFKKTFATLFSGVRHDSGDPYTWGKKMIANYEDLGIDPKTKTLLFSDSLDFKRATEIYNYFHDKTNVAFGIGTYLANDTIAAPLNIVMKVTKCNGQDVAKLSDTEGKGMCKNEDYVDYLRRCINWRLEHE